MLTTLQLIRTLRRFASRSAPPLLFVCAAMSAAGLDGLAQPAARSAIRPDQVVAALGALHISSNGVTLLTQLSATTPEPAFEIKRVEPWGDHRARVRMSCQVHEQCLPFYVEVAWPDATSAQAALGSLPKILVAAEAAAATRPAGSGTGEARVALPAVRATTAHAADRPVSGSHATLEAGSRATLLIEGERLHIRVPVICLESGDRGSSIRVAGLDRKQTYLAEVVDGTVLKGTL
jgi:hypothetical protein